MQTWECDARTEWHAQAANKLTKHHVFCLSKVKHHPHAALELIIIINS